MRLSIFGALLLAGCGSKAPHWALDFVFLTPSNTETTGLATWQVYKKGWKKSFSERHYLCSVLVELEGVASNADCSECIVAFDVTPTVLEDDCAPGFSDDALYTSVQRVGVTAVVDGGPYTDQSSVGFMDYGEGWELHGWAYPDALTTDEAPESPQWNGLQPFLLAPSAVWDLTAASTTPAVSRSVPDGWDGTVP